MLNRRRGFTLIELLVVVAIIALLIAILLPSLGRAKASAVRVKCAAVLKQWGIVVQTYAQENENVFGNNWRDPGPPAANHSWNTGTPAMYDAQWNAKFSVGLRTCPGDQSYGMYMNNGTAGTTGAQRQTDYSFARYINAAGAKETGQHTSLWKLTEMTHPATTWLIGDGFTGANVSYVADLGTLDVGGVEGTLHSALDQRHMGTGNVGFLDGHVEQHNYPDLLANIWDGTGSVGGKTWTVYAPY